MKRVCAIAITASAVALGGVGCSGTQASGVSLGTVPVSAPSAAQDGAGTCVIEGSVKTGPVGGPLVTVDTNPTAVTIVWVPGMNQRPCVSQLSHGGEAAARRLAKDIMATPKFPNGVLSCPSDDGTSMRLYFTYAHKTRAERADVEFEGCGGISAPGRSPRSGSVQLARDAFPLAPITPDAWRQRLG